MKIVRKSLSMSSNRCPLRLQLIKIDQLLLHQLFNRVKNKYTTISELHTIVLLFQVDIDLFLTLTDKDLIEIGIEHERDRCLLLEIIEECKRCKTY